MILLTRLNRLPLVLNADLIESIEVTPDTVISLTTGQKLVVLEAADEVVRRVVEFRRAIYSGGTPGPCVLTGEGGAVDRGAGSENRRGNASDNRATS